MEDWKKVLARSITKPKDLAKQLGVDEKEIADIVGPYPMRITPTVLATIKEKGDAIWKQVVPEMIELDDIDAKDDPLEEDTDSPVPHLVHRYPDRVLLMVTNQCPIYCRFCTRKRLVGKPGLSEEGRARSGGGLFAGTYRSTRCHLIRAAIRYCCQIISSNAF